MMSCFETLLSTTTRPKVTFDTPWLLVHYFLSLFPALAVVFSQPGMINEAGAVGNWWKRNERRTRRKGAYRRLPQDMSEQMTVNTSVIPSSLSPPEVQPT